MNLENYDPALHHLLKAIPEIADAGCAADHLHHLQQAARITLTPPMEPSRHGAVSADQARSAARTLLEYLRDHMDREQAGEDDPVATLNYDLNGALSEAAWALCESEPTTLSRMATALKALAES